MSDEHVHDEHCDHAFDQEMVDNFIAKVAEAAEDIFRDGTTVTITVRAGSMDGSAAITVGKDGILSPTEGIAVLKGAIETLTNNIAEVEKSVG